MGILFNLGSGEHTQAEVNCGQEKGFLNNTKLMNRNTTFVVVVGLHVMSGIAAAIL